MKTLLFSLLIISFLSVSACHAAVAVGGWQPIKNISDPKIQKIAEFALSTRNKENGEHLILVKVLSGERQVVAGTNYRLVLEARQLRGIVVGKYEATVFQSPDNKLRLTSFDPIYHWN